VAVQGVNGLAVAAAAAGALLAWSGFKGAKVTTALRSLLSGQQPQASVPAYPVTSPAASGSPGAAGEGSGGSLGAPAAPADVSGNVAIGKMLATAYGWGTGAEWNDLYALWQRESGWNNHAQNPTSGAYGIPQALPPSKMGAAANPPLSSATAQIAWGLGYIQERYGDPSAAWAHETSAGWY